MINYTDINELSLVCTVNFRIITRRKFYFNEYIFSVKYMAT